MYVYIQTIKTALRPAFGLRHCSLLGSQIQFHLPDTWRWNLQRHQFPSSLVHRNPGRSCGCRDGRVEGTGGGGSRPQVGSPGRGRRPERPGPEGRSDLWRAAADWRWKTEAGEVLAGGSRRDPEREVGRGLGSEALWDRREPGVGRSQELSDLVSQVLFVCLQVCLRVCVRLISIDHNTHAHPCTCS